MFKKKVTGYLVVMLILFQSFTAVASTLDFHTLDVEHLAEVHEHDKRDAHASIQPETNATSSGIATPTESPHNPSDCHHCGHCHGSHSQCVGDFAGITPPLNDCHAFFYLTKVIDAPITRLLRPPKFTS